MVLEPPKRYRLPDTRPSITHRVKIHTEEGPISVYLIAGQDPESLELREVFITSKDVNVRPYDDWATDFSILLQCGYPLKDLVRKHAFTNRPPKGMTDNYDIPFCKSIIDYAARWLAITFGNKELRQWVLGDKAKEVLRESVDHHAGQGDCGVSGEQADGNGI